MKKTLALMLLLALIGAAALADAAPGRPILYTVYRQMGWGDAVQAGFVDEDGGAWTLTGSASAMKWPGRLEDQLELLTHSDSLEKVGALDRGALMDLKSLIDSAEAQPVKARPAACDAGTEKSAALRYGGDGALEAVWLGMSGDDVYENTDPGAQTLYLVLRRLFPGVTCYGGDMGPAGFRPVPVADFLGLDREAIRGAKVKACYVDCEEGLIDVECDAESARAVVLNGTVTGKATALETTGGMTAVGFYDADDNYVGGYQVYEGLLVTNDGMYAME